MRRLVAPLLGVAVALGCRGKDAPPKQQPPASPAVTADAMVDAWSVCKAALTAAPSLPPTKRAISILDACRPCGDWKPLLEWSVLPTAGGPDRRVIEQAMLACDGFCDSNAKMRFLGALDDARAKQTRTPWRQLGDACKAEVSAVPDPRYMSAPYFALDRIARDVGKRPDGAKLLEPITIPLPAVSQTGAGLALPASPLTKPTEPAAQLTISQAELRVGTLPVAKLGATGITVIGGPYPGELVAISDLAAELDKLGDPVAVFAPSGMPAARLAEVARARGTHTLHLAVTANGPVGWTMHGTVPVALGSQVANGAVTLEVEASADAAISAAKAAPRAALRAAPVAIRIHKTATVASLAKLLGALAFFEVSEVALVPPKP